MLLEIQDINNVLYKDFIDGIINAMVKMRHLHV